MKAWHGLLALFMVLVFLLGVGIMGMAEKETNSKQEIECIKAGGKMQSFPKMCTKSD